MVDANVWILTVEEMGSVTRNFAPSADRIFSSGLNGSDPEQIVHDKVGRLSLEAINTWNTIFDGVMWIFSYDKRSLRK